MLDLVEIGGDYTKKELIEVLNNTEETLIVIDDDRNRKNNIEFKDNIIEYLLDAEDDEIVIRNGRDIFEKEISKMGKQ